MHRDDSNLNYPKTFCRLGKQTAKLWGHLDCDWSQSHHFRKCSAVPHFDMRTVCRITATTAYANAVSDTIKGVSHYYFVCLLTGFNYDAGDVQRNQS